MSDLIDDIALYLQDLNGEGGLRVSVHFRYDLFNRMQERLAAMLLPYNCHINAYCVTVKNVNRPRCLQNQKEIIGQCQNGKAFCRVCHAGVYEYLHPVFYRSEAVGFIAVSGYRDGAEGEIVDRALWESALEPVLPLERCKARIPPLCMMLEAALQDYLKESSNEYRQILQFLKEYHTNVTLSELAKHFNRSKSHISHLFKRENGQTIRAYCNELKLEDARTLLLNTELSVTAIGLSVGFNDTGYFIQLFKKRFGQTPLRYRKAGIF